MEVLTFFLALRVTVAAGVVFCTMLLQSLSKMGAGHLAPSQLEKIFLKKGQKLTFRKTVQKLRFYLRELFQNWKADIHVLFWFLFDERTLRRSSLQVQY